QPGDIDRLAKAGVLEGRGLRAAAEALKLFEGDRPPSEMPLPSAFAEVSSNQLLALGRSLADIRQQEAVQLRAGRGGDSGKAAAGTNLINAALTAVRHFESNISASPIGMLNLERLEMHPAGVERGALLATIPLAPLEKTSVVHKEWSVTTNEFTSI